MTPHPTTVHQVCDLRRHDLLVQAERELRADLLAPHLSVPTLPPWLLRARICGIVLLLAGWVAVA